MIFQGEGKGGRVKDGFKLFPPPPPLVTAKIRQLDDAKLVLCFHYSHNADELYTDQQHECNF